MFEPKSKTIDDINFKVMPLPAIEALKLKAYLLRTFSPALGQALGSLNSGGDGLNINGKEMAGALQTLFSQLSDADYIDLVKRFLKSVICEVPAAGGGNTVVDFQSEFDAKLDLVFGGKLMTLYPLMYFILEVNFPDFFAKVGGFGSRIQTTLLKKAATSDQKPSTKSEPSES